MGETPYMACLVDWDEHLSDDYLNLEMMGWARWIPGLGGTGSKMAAELSGQRSWIRTKWDILLGRDREKIPLNPNSNGGL